MATFGPQFGDNDQGLIELEPRGAGKVEVFLTPSSARLRAAGREGDHSARVLLLRFDEPGHAVTLFPVNTMPISTRFLKPKHDPIVSITIVQMNSFRSKSHHLLGDLYDVPQTVDDVLAYLAEELPSGFIKDPNYGLGLDRKLSHVISAISQIDGVSHLRITDEKTLEVSLSKNGDTYEMGYTLFNALRRRANLFDNKAQALSRKKKQHLAYTNLLTRIDHKRFPLNLVERDPGDVADVIGRSIIDVKLSDKDRAAVVGLAEATVRTTIKTHRAAVFKLHDEIELASLDELIAHIESAFATKATELQWQTLFEANPFILDLAFNVPVLLLQGQAHLGGKKLSGTGDAIADFLFSNQLTDNISVLEIKTPSTPLLATKAYRGGVFSPSSELGGGVAQVLNQINRLQGDIARLRDQNREHRIESFGIRGVLVAGIIPDAPQRRSFELYRNALASVSIITFDELLTKLKSLRALLIGKSRDHSSIQRT